MKKFPHLLILAAISSLFMLIQLGNPLAGGHSDEPLYIGIARDMMNRHEWVIPTDHGTPAFYKPPLLYWMMIASFKIFGSSSLFAARFPAALCGVAAILFTALLGKELFGEPEGIAPSALTARSLAEPPASGGSDSLARGKLAGWLTATTIPGFYAYARAALMDIPLVCFITASLYFTVRAAKEKKAWFMIPAFLCWALASLLKGPVGLLIPILPILWIFYREKSWRLLFSLQSAIGFIAASAIIVWWPFAVYERGEWNQWLHFFIVQENFGKFNRQFDPTTKVTPGSVVWIHLLSQFMPWSFFFLAAVLLLFKKENRNSPATFSILWIASVVVIFLLPEKKLSHYMLPAIPATAILVSGMIVRNATHWLSKIAFYCTSVIFVIVGFVLFPLSAITYGLANTLLILAASALFLSAAICALKRKLQPAACAVGFFLILFAIGLPRLMSTLNVGAFKNIIGRSAVFSYKIDMSMIGTTLEKEIPYIESSEQLKGKSGILVVRESDEANVAQQGVQLSKPLLTWYTWQDHIRMTQLFHAIRTRNRAFLHQPIAAVHFQG